MSLTMQALQQSNRIIKDLVWFKALTDRFSWLIRTSMVISLHIYGHINTRLIDKHITINKLAICSDGDFMVQLSLMQYGPVILTCNGLIRLGANITALLD